jgi:hypothetical protein
MRRIVTIALVVLLATCSDPSPAPKRYGSIGTNPVTNTISDTRDTYDAVHDCGLDNTGVIDGRTALVACIATAKAHQIAVSRPTTIAFPGGTYIFTKTPAHIYTAQLTNISDVAFVGPRDGLRAKLLKQGNAGAGEWRLFDVNTGSQHIVFDGLIMDGSGATNTDPAEQDHLINIGPNAHDIQIRNLEMYSTVGDCVRLLGEFGQWNDRIEIANDHFYNCGRASISFQRYNRKVFIHDNTFSGGTDQQIDFEPTGYTLVASSSGGSNTVLSCNGGGGGANTCQFTTWAIQVGDPILDRTTGDLVYVVSVDSQTQLTTTALSGANTWNSTSFSFDSNVDHLIANNLFDYETGTGSHPTTGVELCFTISGATRLTVTGNTFRDCSVQGVDVRGLMFIGNNIYTGQRGGTEHALQIEGAGGENVIADNQITVRQTPGDLTTVKHGIDIQSQAGNYQSSVLIIGNMIREEANGVGIDVEDTKTALIEQNAIVKANAGTSGQPTAINIRAVNTASTAINISNNRVRADQGAAGQKFTNCIQIAATGVNVATAIVNTNTCDNSTDGIVFAESGGGKFTSPPMVVGDQLNTNAGNQIGMPTAHPWIGIGGCGSNTTMTFCPAEYWGTQDPTSSASDGTFVLGAEGSIYHRKGGSAGNRIYINSDGAHSWTAIAGV